MAPALPPDPTDPGAKRIARKLPPNPTSTGPGRRLRLSETVFLWGLVAVQLLGGGYFLSEILASIFGLPSLPLRWQAREIVELAATLGLILGAILSVRLALRAGREIHRAATARRLTAGEFSAVVGDYFATLGLTDAENEVAWLILKGMSVAEIAGLRGTAEGTVRVQSTAIYRKAGVSGKSQLVALLVEDLLL